uniref:Uncharacterized protein n=1 Tax=Strigamia maritima TaxID=126957 RepID=T1ILZ3_STRMM
MANYLLLVLAFGYCTVETADENCFKSRNDLQEAIEAGFPPTPWLKLSKEKCRKENPNAESGVVKNCTKTDVLSTRHELFEKFKNKMIEGATENKKKVIRETVEKCASENSKKLIDLKFLTQEIMHCSFEALKKGICTKLQEELNQ